MRAHRLIPVLAVLGTLAYHDALEGQRLINNLEIRAGVSGEAYFGDFSSLLVPQLDSSESALAGVGEWSASGVISLIAREHQTLDVVFDGGIRQFATAGFRLRNYAPREHSGLVVTRYNQHLGSGSVSAEATVRVRGIADSPPMPLYLQPGYDKYGATIGYNTRIRTNVHVDFAASGELADFAAPVGLPALDLLDRSSVTVRAGATRILTRAKENADPEQGSRVRLFGTYGHHSYPGQGGEGVLRADQAFGLGAVYQLTTARLGLTISVGGTLSRSNSPRVEYNAGRVEADLTWELGANTQIDVKGILARKRHTRPGQDALVPGEEADNASVLSATLTRWLGADINGSFRLGWRDVETNISGAYYTRFGGSFFLSFWPKL